MGVMGDLTRSVRLRYVEGRGDGVGVKWIKEGVVQSQEMLGEEGDIAQWYVRMEFPPLVYVWGVELMSSDPYLLTMFLVEEAVRKGAEFVQAAATKLDIQDGQVKAVHAIRQDGTSLTIACDNIVIAAGPWTCALSKRLLPSHSSSESIPITSYAGHSIIIRPTSMATTTTHLPAECLFMTLKTRQNSSYNPEIFPRSSGQVYLCGINSAHLPLPSTPLAALPQPKEISKLKDIAETLFGEYTLEKEQLCFRPMTSHGDPFVGPVGGVEGVYVGAGHSFWGITLGPGTGKVLAEMVLGEHSCLSADVSALAPRP